VIFFREKTKTFPAIVVEKHPNMKYSTVKKAKEHVVICSAREKSENELIERYFGRTGAFDTFIHLSTVFSRIKSNVYRNETTNELHRMTFRWHYNGYGGRMRVNCDDRMMHCYLRFASDQCRLNSSTVLKAWKVFSSDIVICYISPRPPYNASKRQYYLQYFKYMLDENSYNENPFIDVRHLRFKFEHDCSVLFWFDRADRMIFWKCLNCCFETTKLRYPLEMLIIIICKTRRFSHVVIK
jgi:hypothetical protein